MPAKVVDSSAVAALLFGEPSAPTVAERFRGGILIAPALLMYELANVCLKKIRAHPEGREAFLMSFEVWKDMGIDLVAVDFTGVLPLAEQLGLSGYDASYLWLAHRLDAELVTLDRQLERAAALLQQRTPPP
jgi:predicted nucleic acid-binding protein